MRTLYWILAVCIISSICLTSGAKEKKKKTKKAFNWEDVRPSKLSGNKDMDAYLQSCDTLWYQIQNYRDSISFFKLDTTIAQDADGNKLLVVKITDEQGNPRNFSKSFVQGADIVFSGTNILLDAANISMLTTSAALALTDNPLLAFSYGKCLKAGPVIAKLAFKEIKEIMDHTKAQMKATKSMRYSKMEGSTDQAYILPAEGDIPEDVEIKNLDEIDLGNSDDEVDLEGLDVDLEETVLPEDKGIDKK